MRASHNTTGSFRLKLTLSSSLGSFLNRLKRSRIWIGARPRWGRNWQKSLRISSGSSSSPWIPRLNLDCPYQPNAPSSSQQWLPSNSPSKQKPGASFLSSIKTVTTFDRISWSSKCSLWWTSCWRESTKTTDSRHIKPWLVVRLTVMCSTFLKLRLSRT